MFGSASTPLVCGHGRLISPPSRSSMWRLGYPTIPNYTDNELFCGGFERKKANEMRCGVCGDPYDAPSPQDNAMGGKYYTGIITKNYSAGEEITATVELTANHDGFFEFKLCPVNGNASLETDQCMREHPMEVIGKRRRGSYPYRYYVPIKRAGIFNVRLRVPNISCTQCVFQWTYTAGNNWGTCDDGIQEVGCGPQETFRGCADVSITKDNGGQPPFPLPSPKPQFSTFRPLPLPGPNKKCVAIGRYATQPGMDNWCTTNCKHRPPNCPPSICSCN
ncbi:uncharacterized protein LOC111251826 isoform X2 [Varroa destructor]|uniref:Chitin-binding type-4 domain-containing protein n=1 Tax=Varroa destructor TaxID=109461 RepID=A0A7M7KJJ6_VARDE|nr:uncharacterized protein LOC111251826 isoform X2 [Varroa destructor]